MPLTSKGFLKLVKPAGVAAKLPFTVHPHMLRHACGYKLTNDGHDTRAIQLYKGHKNIQNTVSYTQLSTHRFKKVLGRLEILSTSSAGRLARARRTRAKPDIGILP